MKFAVYRIVKLLNGSFVCTAGEENFSDDDFERCVKRVAVIAYKSHQERIKRSQITFLKEKVIKFVHSTTYVEWNPKEE